MKKWLIVTSALVLLTACGQQENQTNSENKFDKEELDLVLDNYKNNENFMGSVAILKDGKPVYSYVTGYSDYSSGTLATGDTKYRIASVTKSFTGLLTLIAVEEGKISLSQTLDGFFPDIVNADKITIEQMLRHSSGLRSFTGAPDFMQHYENGIEIDKMVENITSYPSDFEPGTKEAYSNSNTYLLTLILEDIYKKPYAELIESKISQPLSLANTYYATELSASRNEAYSYNNEDKMERSKEANHSVMLGAGGIVSTAGDLTKFFDDIFNAGIINEDSLSKMTLINDTYGLGMQEFTFTGRTSYGHRGHVDEFDAIALYYPEERISIAIIDNSSFYEVPNIAKSILNSYFKESIHTISVEELERFVGIYEADGEDNKPEFERDGDKLIHVIAGEFRAELIYLGNYQFLLDQSYAPAITFTFAPDGSKLLFQHKESEWEYIKQQ